MCGFLYYYFDGTNYQENILNIVPLLCKKILKNLWSKVGLEHYFKCEIYYSTKVRLLLIVLP